MIYLHGSHGIKSPNTTLTNLSKRIHIFVKSDSRRFLFSIIPASFCVLEEASLLLISLLFSCLFVFLYQFIHRFPFLPITMLSLNLPFPFKSWGKMQTNVISIPLQECRTSYLLRRMGGTLFCSLSSDSLKGYQKEILWPKIQPGLKAGQKRSLILCLYNKI